MLALDQNGQRVYIRGKHPRSELLKTLHATHADKLYRDTKSGVVHVGYIIQRRWFTLYEERQIPQH